MHRLYRGILVVTILGQCNLIVGGFKAPRINSNSPENGYDDYGQDNGQKEIDSSNDAQHYCGCCHAN